VSIKTQIAEEARQADIAKLRTFFPLGSHVATIVTHVVRSGMSRSIKVLAVEDGRIWDVSWLVASVLRERVDRDHGGVKTTGVGMDMPWYLIYRLASTLYPDADPSESLTRDQL
jgi:hypothetical protein